MPWMLLLSTSMGKSQSNEQEKKMGLSREDAEKQMGNDTMLTDGGMQRREKALWGKREREEYHKM